MLYYRQKERKGDQNNDKQTLQQRPHHQRETHQRNQQIGEGTPVKEVRVDRGHKDGAELHTITTNGIIIIRNERTNKMITKLIARPNQIKRYGIEDKKVIEIARKHQSLGYNMI